VASASTFGSRRLAAPADGAGLPLVSKNPYRPPRPGTSGTRDALDTHVLSIIAVRAVKPHELVTLLATEATGTSPRVPGLPAFSVPAFTVEDGALVKVALDGEPAVLDPPLKSTSLPEASRLRMPLAHRRASHLRRPQSQRDRPRTFFPLSAADRALYHTVRVRAPRGPQR
jgi:hypothetical protein